MQSNALNFIIFVGGGTHAMCVEVKEQLCGVSSLSTFKRDLGIELRSSGLHYKCLYNEPPGPGWLCTDSIMTVKKMLNSCSLFTLYLLYSFLYL